MLLLGRSDLIINSPLSRKMAQPRLLNAYPIVIIPPSGLHRISASINVNYTIQAGGGTTKVAYINIDIRNSLVLTWLDSRLWEKIWPRDSQCQHSGVWLEKGSDITLAVNMDQTLNTNHGTVAQLMKIAWIQVQSVDGLIHPPPIQTDTTPAVLPAPTVYSYFTVWTLFIVTLWQTWLLSSHWQTGIPMIYRLCWNQT